VGPYTGIVKENRRIFSIFYTNFRVLYNRLLAFSRGPGEFREQRRQIDEVKCKAKLDGIPKTWTATEILGNAALKDITGKAVDVEIFRSKGGESLGKAMLTFSSVAERKEAVKKSREIKPAVDGKKVYLNNAKPEFERKMDAPLTKAFSEIKQQWTGDRKELRLMLKEERCIKAAGRTVVVQDEHTWEVAWKIRKEEVTSEERVRKAKASE